jgi:hypothetical protein
VTLAAAIAAGCQAGGGEATEGGVRDADRHRDIDRQDPADASGDSDALDAAPQPGPWTQIATDVAFLADRLCDLDGDGVGNNAIADLGEPGASLVVLALNTSLDQRMEILHRMLFYSPWVDDLSLPDDPELLLVVLGGIDLDDPEDRTDDFSGSEPFYVSASALDGCGEPLYPVRGVRIDRGELEAAPGDFPFPMFEAPTTIAGSRVTGTVAPGGGSAEFLLCGYGTIPELGSVPGLTEAGDLTMLELFVAGGAVIGFPSVPGLDPDVDVDLDGLERLLVDDAGHLETCIDGDGTPIEGRECSFDERMADGFSIVVRMASTSALLVGRQPDWQSAVDGGCEGGPPDASLWGFP